MKKYTKAILGVAAAAMVGGAATLPALVAAWGGERTFYTLDQVEHDALGDKITFNSITDGPVGDERYFVHARKDGTHDVWQGGNIEAEDGKTYVVNLFVHNNSPKGTDAIAKDVNVRMGIKQEDGKSVKVSGLISSSNATPKEYWDSVVFNSDKNFHLEYVSGSARWQNNSIGSGEDGVKLSDNIMATSGVKVGYDSLNGEIPGCYKYSGYAAIKVKVVYESESFSVNKQVRKVGETEWHESVKANVGEEVEFRIDYKNTSTENQYNVSVRDVLPNNLEYVKGSTVAFNSKYTEGIALDDGITGSNGLDIGGYKPGSSAAVQFKAKVVDSGLDCGDNTLTNWGQVSVNGATAYQDSASVVTTKVCEPVPTDYTVEKQVRKVGETEWHETIEANVRDEVEYMITYKNISTAAQENVTMSDTLPANMEYVAGTTMLYNDAHADGAKLDDTLTTDKGVNIGNYAAGASARVIFRAKLVDNSLDCGNNKLTNWAQVAVKDKVVKDSAAIDTNKVCSDPEKPVNPDTPKELPATGPETVVSGIIGAGALTTAAGYYLASRKSLKRA